MSKGLFDSIRISATGLRGQRVKMDVVARNLANAETTRTEDGTPYRRQRAVFEEVLQRRLERTPLRHADEGGTRVALTHRAHMAGLRPLQDDTTCGVRTEVTTAADASDFRVVFDPGHPDADAEGYVLLPNVNVITEMVDMITASRAYEANVSAVQSAKEMFNDALKI
ncbi:MAG: flagellar basal body rod protein FlgC [Candidatus Krumholzibacteriia bacterium]